MTYYLRHGWLCILGAGRVILTLDKIQGLTLLVFIAINWTILARLGLDIFRVMW